MQWQTNNQMQRREDQAGLPPADMGIKPGRQRPEQCQSQSTKQQKR
jgi:hypothetical protein